MDIPQDILNKFIVREDYLDWINNEPVIFAYLDLTNMFHWQDILGWKFRIEDVVGQLFTFPNIKEIKIYYGKNERDLENSERLKVKNKKIGVVGVRGIVAKELHDVKDKYIDFGKFYTGKRNYIKSENPAFGGTA